MIARSQLDFLGIIMSFSCALHCVLAACAPILVSMGLTVTFLSHEYEAIVFYGTLIVSSSAMLIGLMKHQSVKLALGFLICLGLLIASFALEHLENESMAPYTLALSICAGCGLIACHIVNSKRLFPKS